MRYTAEQKEDYIARYKASGMGREEFCKNETIGVSTLDRWLIDRKPRKQEVAPDPDFHRDVEILAALNSTPVNAPLDDVDERLAKVLGATIAEVIRRLRS